MATQETTLTGTAVLLADGKRFKVGAPLKVLIKSLSTNTQDVLLDTEADGNFAFALAPGDAFGGVLSAGEFLYARAASGSQVVQVFTSTPQA